MEEHMISIDEDGTVTMIYSDEMRDFMDEGVTEIKRVSNVEPGLDGNWWADMLNGDVLGPYKYRQDALDAEVKYLKEKLF